MNLKEFYEKIGGDYEEVLSRLSSDQRIQKYVIRFLDVPDFEALKEAIAAKDWEKSFLAAHTLKGNALNLGFGNFMRSDAELTEYLRPRTVESEQVLMDLFNKASVDYQNLIDAINELKKSVL